jgi:hypothetical protein
VSSSTDIDLLVAICEDHFRQRGYSIRKGHPLHQHIRWRPNIFATKGQDNIALDVRLTESMPLFFREILKSARRLLPEIRIYMAVPNEQCFVDTYVRQTKSLGIGLFTIDGNILQEKVKPQKPRKMNFVSTPSGKKAQAIILRPGSRYGAWVELGQVLANAVRYVKLIDAYCDEKTLEHLLHVKTGVEIKVITTFSGPRRSQEPIFKAACRQFKSDHPRFEARKSDPKAVHDRYFVTESETWILGPSVKDAGLKFGCLAKIEDPQAKTEIEQFFEDTWNNPSSAKII